MSILCEHQKTKEKLISWAVDYQGEHEQGFRKVECCVDCGCVVTYSTLQQGLQAPERVYEEDL